MFKKKRNHIFITCSPKSGSTYLLQLLATILDYDIRIFIAAFDQTEQDVFEDAIEKAKKLNTVTHQHTRCTNNTIRLLNKHQIKPLVLTRSLYDSVISMRNHMIQEPENSWWPMAYIDEDFYKLDTSSQYDFVIDLILPWYINYYVSWYKYTSVKNKDVLWITYEELMKDKVGMLNRILEYYSIDHKVDEEVLLAAEAKIKGKTRKTVLKGNDQKVYLSESQKGKINRLTDYYPNVDFNKYHIN